MNEVMLAAFTDELDQITKEAGIGSLVMKGLRGWRGAAKGFTSGSRSLGSHGASISKLYRQGAKGAPGMKGVLGGVKRVARSPYGAMGAVAAPVVAAPMAAGYMGGRAAQ
jgi:hypothetical protein